MNSVLTNRLIGSAILVVAAVLFLPDLLDGQKQVNKDEFKPVPERPEFAEVTKPQVFQQDAHEAEQRAASEVPTESGAVLDESDPAPATLQDPLATMPVEPAPAQSSPPPQAADSAVMDKSADKPELNTASQVNESPVNVSTATNTDKPLSKAAFMVKVGAFGKESNAKSLVAKLQAAGFPTFTRPMKNSQGQALVAVFVGPDLKKDKLEKALPQIQQLANVPNLRVSNYLPLEN